MATKSLLEQLVPKEDDRKLLTARYQILKVGTTFEDDLKAWVASQLNKATKQANQIGGSVPLIAQGKKLQAAFDKKKKSDKVEV